MKFDFMLQSIVELIGKDMNPFWVYIMEFIDDCLKGCELLHLVVQADESSFEKETWKLDFSPDITKIGIWNNCLRRNTLDKVFISLRRWIVNVITKSSLEFLAEALAENYKIILI